MMRNFKNGLITLVALAAMSVAGVAATNHTESTDSPRIVKQVRHELLTLPYYGVFDNLEFKVEGNTVTLYGQVVQPSTRIDAERRVESIAGVQDVVNNIKVLPLSSFDDSIRAQAYRAVFSSAGLYRYGMGANPSIHIVVDGGRLTLEGVVANAMDKRLAYIAARGVSGAFSVTNNLRIENDESQPR
jgi:hyperosmotically inducible protein